ncbi:CPBP family intramembrane glutamic endopeptidase [Endozoicomonas sp. ONNA2]|uniref:CPBP family intramembrane glutamic endopeptidase n=1 Tax=Endozoicomonas sp. ONNA2 TaxID=2828741 RepID=UPI002148AF6A|nr:CPBP family intramembrane glutamic endopeptidase [Endozoicomonas sp. ONNA2]
MDISQSLPQNPVSAHAAARENTDPGEQQVGGLKKIRQSDQSPDIGRQQASLPAGVYDSVTPVELPDRKIERLPPSFILTVHKLIKTPGYYTFHSEQRAQPDAFSVSCVEGQQLQIRNASQPRGTGQQQDLMASPAPVALTQRKTEISAATSFILTAHNVIKTSCYTLLSQAAVSSLHVALGILLDQPITITNEPPVNLAIYRLLIAACEEEVIFRFCIQDMLQRLFTATGLGPRRAKQLSLASSSLLFGLAHARNSGRFEFVNVTSRIPPGYFLGKLFQEEGLLASSAAHVLHNIIVMKLLPSILAAEGIKAAALRVLLMTYLAIGIGIYLEACPEIASPNSDHQHKGPRREEH